MEKIWSSQQLAIFAHMAAGPKAGHLIVRARAGTGKTTTIEEGVRRCSPDEKILVCAFNKRIVIELESRIKNATIKTLHSLGFRCVTRSWPNTKIDNDRCERLTRDVMGDEAPDAMVYIVQKLTALAKGACPYPTVDAIVDLAYEHDHVPDEEWEEDGWTLEVLAGHVIEVMDRSCKRDGTIDFDDMVFVPVRNNWTPGRFDTIVVDEAQDMNVAQLILAQRACKKNGRIIIVGDNRQAIYGFRGADSNSIDRMKDELKATELGLTMTRRCPKKVVELAAKIVPDFMALDDAPEGTVIRTNRPGMTKLADQGDFILSRKNAPLASACLALLRAGKKAKIQGRDIGKGLINLVKKIKGKSMPDFLAKLTKWEEREIKRLKATGKKSAEARIDFVIDQAMTLRELSSGLSGLKELTVRIENLFSDTDDMRNVIVCSTVHKAKGLEANRVFIIESSLIRTDKIEERNIEYVAITRAKNELVWVSDDTNEQPTLS